jgi:hypothetical protein
MHHATRKLGIGTTLVRQRRPVQVSQRSPGRASSHLGTTRSAATPRSDFEDRVRSVYQVPGKPITHKSLTPKYGRASSLRTRGWHPLVLRRQMSSVTRREIVNPLRRSLRDALPCFPRPPSQSSGLVRGRSERTEGVDGHADAATRPSCSATGSMLSSIKNESSSVGRERFMSATTAACACSGLDQSAALTASRKVSM